MSQGVKRKRQSTTVRPRKKINNNTKRNITIERGPAIRGDQLKWKPISISQHLDDAEGFYGLEEIDDVEVVRGEDGKGVFFKPVKDADIVASEAIQGSADGEGDDEAWSGFADEAAEPAGDGNAPDEASGDYNFEQSHLLDGSARRGTSPDLSDDLGFDILADRKDDTETDISAWIGLHVSSDLLSAISKLKFASPTLIQKAAIPPVIAGKDVIGKAVTGSGKTLAFGIPIVQYWLNHDDRKQKRSSAPIAMILSPTRELAHQISKHLTDLCQGLDQRPRITTVTGGLSILKQQRQLDTTDIVVATPGRLWEVIRESNDLLGKLKMVKFLVVDEADRLLSEGHFQEVEEILDALDRKIVDDNAEDEEDLSTSVLRQTLVFSATFHKGLQQKLASRKKFNHKDNKLLSEKQSMEYLMHKLPFQDGQKPTFVDANPESQMAENLTETILECGDMQKDLYLYAYLLQEQHKRKIQPRSTENGIPTNSTSRILVFTNSVSAVKRLVPFLQTLELPSTTISPLHSNMPQKSRLRSLERFSGQNTPSNTNTNHTSPSMHVLIATDVAARGLDIQGITTVIHYHVPRTADTYVHRSGRTARVAASGNSILLCSPDEAASVIKLIAKIHTTSHTSAPTKPLIERTHLPASLLSQLTNRVTLSQNLITSTQSTEKVKSEQNWLQTAADDLGVDYDSEEFERAGRQGRRGRGGGKERKAKKIAREEDRNVKMGEWRGELKKELKRRVEFGDGGAGKSGRYLAGGAVDVDRLLAEREGAWGK